MEGGGNIQIITILHNRRGTPKKDCIIHGPPLRLLILVKGGERESEKAQITRDDGFCPEGCAYNHQEHHQGAKLHIHAPEQMCAFLIKPGALDYSWNFLLRHLLTDTFVHLLLHFLHRTHLPNTITHKNIKVLGK